LKRPRIGSWLGLLLMLALTAQSASASTYVVYLPLDSPVYQELDTLDGLGWLDTYISEIKPISRVEAARLTLEAQKNLHFAEANDPLAQSMVRALRQELADEIGWLENDAEDSPPDVVVKPIERFEAQYIFSRGARRSFSFTNKKNEILQAQEGTPLLPNNDDLPTSPGSNEVARISGWAGFGTFLTAYGEASGAGPITRSPSNLEGTQTSRFGLLRGEVVTDLGNFALSWGLEEMSWGTGHFSQLSQSNNAWPFPALRMNTVHPGYLPGFLRYLGPYRLQIFFGQLDHFRTYSRPWLSGQIIAFKPLPTFEFGFDHVVMFGGRGNDNYSYLGFIGRATGLSTGSAVVANTNSRAGLWGKFYIPSLRNTIVYQEVLGEDNLTTEVPMIGRMLPFAGPSFQGGVYVPRLTADGLTTLRFEYKILSQRLSFHADSLYWTYDDRLMGDPLGADATAYDVALGRWIDRRYKVDLDLFYTRRDPPTRTNGFAKEQSAGFAFDLFGLPLAMSRNGGLLGEIRARTAFEYVNNVNFTASNSFRVGIVFSGAILPTDMTWSRN
jgi:hypothetical protein